MSKNFEVLPREQANSRVHRKNVVAPEVVTLDLDNIEHRIATFLAGKREIGITIIKESERVKEDSQNKSALGKPEGFYDENS